MRADGAAVRRVSAVVRPVRRSYFARQAGGRRLSKDGVIEYILAGHNVPGHWTLAGIAWRPQARLYADSVGAFQYEGPALAALTDFAQRENERAPLADRVRDPRRFPRRQRGAQQSDGVSCGVCVLLDMEECARDPEQYFAESACERSRGARRTPLELRRARARFAVALLDAREDDADMALDRRRAHNAANAVIEIGDDDDDDDEN